MERIEEFIEALKEKGIRIWSDNEKLRYQAAKGAMDSQTLEKIKEKKVEILEFLNNKSDIEVVFKSNQAERYEPFPLTNIQNSYVIGRNSAYELGDVTCHGYIEITYQEELDKEKNVSSVTLLSTSIPHKKEETVLADLDMKIFETAVQTSLYNELLLERTFASLIDADIKKAGHQVDNDTLQQVIEYLIFNNGGNITVQALCSLTGKFAEVGAEFQRLHSMSATERMNDLYTTIERPNGQLMEHQRKMLNVLFRVFAQNFRCVSSYIPKVYTGKMRVFDCESAIANFFPSLFSEDKKTWEQYAQGEFLFDTMKGDHISCMNSPYIEENVKKILDL